MSTPRNDYERLAIAQFAQIAITRGLKPVTRFRADNQLKLPDGQHFQFGDLRVTKGTCHVIVEVESAGGVTNLVKYWYILQKLRAEERVVLLHVFRQTSTGDYGSHMQLWDFLAARMRADLGDRFDAEQYTYRAPETTDTSFAAALVAFERWLDQEYGADA
ncbi:hypothetical protein EKD04_019815 [Chloroflexales bacterium ZM16-3]|nr:hypothetical protein [Chloroflexales bacterium ZM16-3]